MSVKNIKIYDMFRMFHVIFIERNESQIGLHLLSISLGTNVSCLSFLPLTCRIRIFTSTLTKHLAYVQRIVMVHCVTERVLLRDAAIVSCAYCALPAN